MKGKKLQEKINALQAELWAVENNIRNSSAEILVEEVLNFLSGCGKGYTEGDYYADCRYYSDIPGVKNFNIVVEGNQEIINIKLLSPIGGLLPEDITIKGVSYEIRYCTSKNFSEVMDY